jgi:hypothetical protein
MIMYAANVGFFMEIKIIKKIVDHAIKAGNISSKRYKNLSEPLKSVACATWKYGVSLNGVVLCIH